MLLTRATFIYLNQLGKHINQINHPIKKFNFLCLLYQNIRIVLFTTIITVIKKSLLNCVPCVPKMCSHANVPCVLMCSRDLLAYVLMCLRVFLAHVATSLACLHAHVPTCHASSSDHMPACLESFASHGLRYHVITCQHPLSPR